ncbi:MAG: helix-turn-helix domain-containing protein [Planctomycetes bacterium]|nr:helix-turn-helix domain-containing protein [Planctomycetota bacterium]
MPCETCGCPSARWLRVDTVARQFNCSPKHIRRLLKRGELSGMRVGRAWRVDHEALDDYVLRHSLRFDDPE